MSASVLLLSRYKRFSIFLHWSTARMSLLWKRGAGLMVTYSGLFQTMVGCAHPPLNEDDPDLNVP